MRSIFDKFYPFAAHLNSLIQNKVFLSAKFEELNESIKAYYEKANDNIQEVRTIIKDYSNVLDKRKNLIKTSRDTSKVTVAKKGKQTIKSIKNIILNKEADLKLMLSQSIYKCKIGLKKDEVYAFQNQYVSIQIYIKSFLNYVMKKINEINQNNEKLKFKYSNRINRIKQRISFLNIQKQKLFEKMLE